MTIQSTRNRSWIKTALLVGAIILALAGAYVISINSDIGGWIQAIHS